MYRALYRALLRPLTLIAMLAAVVSLPVLMLMPVQAAQQVAVVPPPTLDEAVATDGLKTAVLAGGCFWGVQGVFQHTKGVVSAVSGYAGGDRQTARYELISSGTTGHAEAVRVVYDPKQISYGKLLQIYFSVVHDPTQLNRQGPDVGPQYRSEIFAATDEQAEIAQRYITQLNAAKVYTTPIVTKIGSLKAFFPAEDYHQDYMTRNPRQPYIAAHDLPKLENLKTVFGAEYRGTPALTRDTGLGEQPKTQ